MGIAKKKQEDLENVQVPGQMLTAYFTCDSRRGPNKLM